MNRWIYILLIISISLNIGTFAVIIYDRISPKEEHIPPFLKYIDIDEDQLDRIDSIRMKWFDVNDSLSGRIYMLRNEISLIDSIEDLTQDSMLNIEIEMLIDSLRAFEDSHKTMFMKYYNSYGEILDSEQIDKIMKENKLLIKILNIDDYDDEEEKNKIIKKIIIEKGD